MNQDDDPDATYTVEIQSVELSSIEGIVTVFCQKCRDLGRNHSLGELMLAAMSDGSQRWTWVAHERRRTSLHLDSQRRQQRTVGVSGEIAGGVQLVCRRCQRQVRFRVSRLAATARLTSLPTIHGRPLPQGTLYI